jgi:hypothetical protein
MTKEIFMKLYMYFIKDDDEDKLRYLMRSDVNPEVCKMLIDLTTLNFVEIEKFIMHLGYGCNPRSKQILKCLYKKYHKEINVVYIDFKKKCIGKNIVRKSIPIKRESRETGEIKREPRETGEIKREPRETGEIKREPRETE